MEDRRRPLSGTAEAESAHDSPGNAPGTWERPAYTVISLDCEISSYAPDGDGPPLF